MAADENKSLIREYFERGWNAGDAEVAASFFRDDYINHNPGLPGMPPGRAGISMLVNAFRGVFPDLHYTIEAQVAEGDRVATRWTMRGTQQGEFLGVPASGKQVEVAGIQIDRIADGQIVEHWRESDIMGLMQQLGVIPAPGQ
jgi:steroid delta-isomerase-like uncharacterized protein